MIVEWILPNLFRIVVLILLLIVTAFDVKTRRIPSIMTTGIVFFISVFNLVNIPYGIVAFVFAWMLYEADFLDGIADVKMISALGLMTFNFVGIIAMVILITILGSVYISSMKSLLKLKEIPFLPVILATYVSLWIVGII